MEYVYWRSTLSSNMSTAAIECPRIGLQRMYIVIKYIYRGHRVSPSRPTEDVVSLNMSTEAIEWYSNRSTEGIHCH